jgi:hypothetical protein
VKHRNNQITSQIFEIVSRLVYWDQGEPFDEKSGGEKSRGTVPLSGSTMKYFLCVWLALWLVLAKFCFPWTKIVCFARFLARKNRQFAR